MNIVILERNSVGEDVSVDCIRDFGEVTEYYNTVTAQEVRERVKEADIVIANKSPLNAETLGSYFRNQTVTATTIKGR